MSVNKNALIRYKVLDSCFRNHAKKYFIEDLIEVVLERLYTLRNQLIHGGATYNSKLNRSQLRDACNIMQLLVPIIIDIMLENGEHDWGEIAYPVIH